MKRCTTALLKWFAESKRVLFSISSLLPKYNMCWEELLGPAVIIATVFSKRLPPILPGCQWRDTVYHGQVRIRKIMVLEGSLSCDVIVSVLGRWRRWKSIFRICNGTATAADPVSETGISLSTRHFPHNCLSRWSKGFNVNPFLFP